MNKLQNYIDSLLSDGPGRIVISAKEIYFITLLLLKLNEARRRSEPLVLSKDNFDGQLSYTAKDVGESIDLHNYLTKKLSRIKNMSITSLDSPAIYYISISNLSNLTNLKLEMVPPSTIEGLYQLRYQLQSLEIINSGITELSSIFIPVASKNRKLMQYLRPMTTIDPKQQPFGSPTITEEINSHTDASDMSNDLKENYDDESFILPHPSQLDTIIPVEYLWQSLFSLKLINCGISRLDESFHFFPYLASLDLSKNQFSHVFHLQDCYRIKFLNLSSNRISVLSNVHLVVGNVKVLDISNNQIQSIHGVDRLFSLQKLNLSNNRIDDYNEISYLIKLPLLESIDLNDNPIAQRPNYRHLVYSQLIEDGSVFRNDYHSLPCLDGNAPSEEELKSFRSVMFRPLEENPITVSSTKSNSFTQDGSMSENHQIASKATITSKSSFANSSNLEHHIRSPEKSIYGYDEYSMKSNPHLLLGWQNLRNRSFISASSDTIDTISTGSGRLEPVRYRKRVVKIADDNDDSLTIYPSIEDIKNNLIESRRKLMDSVTSSNRRTNHTMSPLQVPSPTTPSSPHNHPAEIVNENDLPEVIRHKLKLDNVVSIQTRSPLAMREETNPFDPPNHTKLKISKLHLSPSSNSSNDISHQKGSGMNVIRHPFPHDVSPTNSERSLLLKIPLEANLLLDMNDLASVNSDLLIGSSAGGVSADDDSRITENRMLSSAKHHDRLITIPSDQSSTERSIANQSLLTDIDNVYSISSDSLTSVSPRSFISPIQQDRSQHFISNPFQANDPQGTSRPVGGRLRPHGESSVSDTLILANLDSNHHESRTIIDQMNRNDDMPSITTNELTDQKPVIPPINKDESLSKYIKTREYRGSEEYSSYSVLDNLDLYFREQIFHTNKETNSIDSLLYIQSNESISDDNRSSIQLILRTASSERFSSLYVEKIVLVEKKRTNSNWKPPSPIPPSIAGKSSPRTSRVSNDNTIKRTNSEDEKMIDEVKMIIAISNVAVYILRFNEFVPGQRFIDAPIPTLFAQHHISDLMHCTIFFGFQRCILTFASLLSYLSDSIPPSTTDLSISSPSHTKTSLEYANQRYYAFLEYYGLETISDDYLTSYMILTREKAKTYPLITKIQQLSNTCKGLIAAGRPFKNVKMITRDSDLFKQITDITYYQMLYQIWPKHSGIIVPRTLIITPLTWLLCDENLLSNDVSIKILETVSMKDIQKITLDDNTNHITISFRSMTKAMFSLKKKWHFQSDNQSIITRLYEEGRRICIDHGNNDI